MLNLYAASASFLGTGVEFVKALTCSSLSGWFVDGKARWRGQRRSCPFWCTFASGWLWSSGWA